MEVTTPEDDKQFVAGYLKGYITAFEHVQKYCEDMIRSKQKEFDKP